MSPHSIRRLACVTAAPLLVVVIAMAELDAVTPTSAATATETALEGFIPLGPPTLEELDQLTTAPPPREKRSRRQRPQPIPQDAEAASDPAMLMLQSTDPIIRIRAVEALAVLNTADSTAMVLTALSDEDAEVREEARQALATVAPSSLVDCVVGVLGWGDPDLAVAVDQALPMLRDVLDPPLTALFEASDKPRTERMAAAYCLGRIGSQRAGTTLANAVWGDDLALAYYCADALVTIEDHGLLREMIRMATHPQVRMRVAAYQALARIGGEEARAAITEAAAGRTERDTSARKVAIRMLGFVGDANSIEFLIDLVRARTTLVRPASDALAMLTGMPRNLERERWLEWYDEVFAPQRDAFADRMNSKQTTQKSNDVPLGFPKDGFPFTP